MTIGDISGSVTVNPASADTSIQFSEPGRSGSPLNGNGLAVEKMFGIDPGGMPNKVGNSEQRLFGFARVFDTFGPPGADGNMVGINAYTKTNAGPQDFEKLANEVMVKSQQLAVAGLAIDLPKSLRGSAEILIK
jgi:hypothetical protein